jgi:serine protease Do
MLKRTCKVLILISALCVVAGAQTIVSGRCQQAPGKRGLESKSLTNVPLLPNGFGDLMALPDGFGDSLMVLPDGIGDLTALSGLGDLSLLEGAAALTELPEGLGDMNALLGQVEWVPGSEFFWQGDANQTDSGPMVFSLGAGSYLGVYLDEVTAERVKQLGLKEERGAVVTKVINDSPASKAGIKENDVVVAFNGRPVESVRELQRLLSDTPTGRTVSIEVVRGGNRQTISATLTQRSFLRSDLMKSQQGAWKQTEEAQKRSEEAQRLLQDRQEWLQRIPKGSEFGNFSFVFPDGFRGVSRLGVSVESMSEQLAGYFGAKEGGVLVTEVRENSAAAKGGIKAGDVIVGIDAENVKSANDLMRAVRQKEEGQITVKVIRDRSTKTFTVTLEKQTRPGTRTFALPSRKSVV